MTESNDAADSKATAAQQQLPANLAKNSAAALRVIRQAADDAATRHGGTKRQLFDASQLFLTVGLATASTATSATSSSILLTLPHPLYSTATDSGCLITKDLVRRPEDFEATGAHFTDLLRSSGCQSGLTVLPLRELTVAYMPFEAKRRLCQSYDYFLADQRVAHRLGNKLGSHFAAKNRRKLPLPVDLEAKDLAAELDRARRTARVCLDRGSTSCALIGQLDQLSDEQLAENVQSACSQLFKRLPQVSGLYLRHRACGNVPIHVAKEAASPAKLEEQQQQKKATRRAPRDLDKDLAELGASLWDKDLLPQPNLAGKLKLKVKDKKRKSAGLKTTRRKSIGKLDKTVKPVATKGANRKRKQKQGTKQK